MYLKVGPCSRFRFGLLDCSRKYIEAFLDSQKNALYKVFNVSQLASRTCFASSFLIHSDLVYLLQIQYKKIKKLKIMLNLRMLWFLGKGIHVLVQHYITTGSQNAVELLCKTRDPFDQVSFLFLCRICWIVKLRVKSW